MSTIETGIQASSLLGITTLDGAIQRQGAAVSKIGEMRIGSEHKLGSGGGIPCQVTVLIYAIDPRADWLADWI